MRYGRGNREMSGNNVTVACDQRRDGEGREESKEYLKYRQDVVTCWQQMSERMTSHYSRFLS